MTYAEIDRALAQMVYIVDTREQDTERARRRWQQLGNYERAKLNFGDYSAKVVTDHGEIDLSKSVVIERKMSLDEIVGNFCEPARNSPDVVEWNKTHKHHLRNRFEFEFQRAKEQNAKVYLLIENGSYEGIYAHRYKGKFQPQSFIASLFAFQARYNLSILFCKPEVSGKVIKDILKYEMRERLMNIAEGGE